MRYYEDLEIDATSVRSERYLVTEEEILEMGRRWDPQPFHTDPEAAAASVFGGLVASTVHLFAIVTKIGMAANQDLAVVSALGMTDFVNHAPARPGDQVTFGWTVIDRRESKSRPTMGIVTSSNLLTNQRDEPVFSFVNSWLVERRP
jgi:acyl dehydratase